MFIGDAPVLNYFWCITISLIKDIFFNIIS